MYSVDSRIAKRSEKPESIVLLPFVDPAGKEHPCYVHLHVERNTYQRLGVSMMGYTSLPWACSFLAL